MLKPCQAECPNIGQIAFTIGGVYVLSGNQLAILSSIHSQSLRSWLVQQRAGLEGIRQSMPSLMLIVTLVRVHCRGRSVGQGSAASQHSMPQQPAANLLADGGGWPGCDLSSMRALRLCQLQDVKHQRATQQLQSGTRCCTAQAPPNPPCQALHALNAQPSGQAQAGSAAPCNLITLTHLTPDCRPLVAACHSTHTAHSQLCPS